MTKLKQQKMTSWNEFTTTGLQTLLESIKDLDRIEQQHETISGKINRLVIVCNSYSYSLEVDIYKNDLQMFIRDDNNRMAFMYGIEKETFESFEVWQNPTYKDEWYLEVKLIDNVTITFKMHRFSWEN